MRNMSMLMWFIVCGAVALAQPASTGANLSLPSTSDGLDATVELLLAEELANGFHTVFGELTVEEGREPGTFNVLVPFETSRNEQFTHMFIEALSPYSVDSGEDLFPITAYGDTPMFGRAGSITLNFEFEQTQAWHARHLAALVKLIDANGLIVAQGEETIYGHRSMFYDAFALSPIDEHGYSTTREFQVRIPGLTAVQVVAVDVVEVEYVGTWLSLDPVWSDNYGVYFGEADATELQIQPGLVIFGRHSQIEYYRGPWTAYEGPQDTATVKRLENAVVITHIDGQPVTATEDLGSRLVQSFPMELTIWLQYADTYAVITYDPTPTTPVNDRAKKMWGSWNPSTNGWADAEVPVPYAYRIIEALEESF